ncbi:MAG: DegV family protein [Anaeroplasmataceae bacterium]
MIKLVIDSASDFNKDEALKQGIEIVPLHVRFKDKEYLDGIDLSPSDFFLKLIESTELPKTAQITPYEFETVFKKYPDDKIICITLSKKLSGTYQSACIAASEFDNVEVIDSNNVTIGEQILIKYAIELINKNMEYEDIIKELNEKKKNIKLIALLDTLEYLKKGGRISAFSATVGTFLHIKPVVEVIKGEVKLIGKARGSKIGNNKLREKVQEYGGIDFNMPYALAYSGLSDHLLNKYIEDSKDLYTSGIVLEKYLIGSTIGTHVGPGAIAVAFFKNGDKNE